MRTTSEVVGLTSYVDTSGDYPRVFVMATLADGRAFSREPGGLWEDLPPIPGTEAALVKRREAFERRVGYLGLDPSTMQDSNQVRKALARHAAEFAQYEEDEAADPATAMARAVADYADEAEAIGYLETRNAFQWAGELLAAEATETGATQEAAE